jgi:hypothetical protein
LIAPFQKWEMAASPRSLENLAKSCCGREMAHPERAEDGTVCTLTALSGQDEFYELIDSVVNLIG